MGHQRDLALSARSFLRPVTERRIRLNPDLGYWGGVTWVHYVTIVQGPGASPDIIVEAQPGPGNEFDLQSTKIFNGDTESRFALVEIRDQEGNILDFLDSITMTAGQSVTWPRMNTTTFGGPGRRTISGDMILRLRLITVGAGDDAEFGIVGRVRGEKPTVTHSFEEAGGTLTIDTDEFF